MNTTCPYMKTPEWVPTKCIVNVQNDDEECFKWAVLAAMFPVKENAYRVSKYKPLQDKLNFNGISYLHYLMNGKSG